MGLGIAASIGVLWFLENRNTHGFLLDGAASVPGMIYQGTGCLMELAGLREV